MKASCSHISAMVVVLSVVYSFLPGCRPAAACGVPLSVQDIQNGIMPSEANLPCTSNQGSTAPQRPSAQQVRWQTANRLFSQANDAAERRDLTRAIALYQQAIDLLRLNGDQKNIALVQRNLTDVQKQYAAIKDDGRVDDARSRFADQNIYTKPNPFAEARPQISKGPLVDANSLRAQQGNCSDITGVGGGGGPSNCTPSNGIPPNVQPQIDHAQSNPQAGRNGSPGDAAMQAAIQRLREEEAMLRAAGDLAAAAAAAEQVEALEKAAQRHAASCPPLGPATYWVGTPNEEYCANANCVERGSAYYGLICFPKHRGSLPDEEWEKFCQEALAKLKPLAANYDEQWLADEMKRSDPSCDVDGTPLTLRKQLERALKTAN